MSATMTDDVVKTETSDTPGEASHIVQVPGHLRGKVSPQAYVMEATVNGTEIVALCGHRWIPGRDPKARPICERCLSIFRDDPQGHGDRDELPEA